ncbi:MAG: SLC13 family permease [Eggerthellaceae bacterium]|nr:SLC13 family permease [Eggerthellaceae bacterium]
MGTEDVVSKHTFGTPFPDAKTQRNRLIGIIIAAIVFLIFQFALPTPEGLPHTAMSAAGILFACIILWCTEGVPFTITVVLIYFLLPITGILPYSDVTGVPVDGVIVGAGDAAQTLEPAKVYVTNSVFNQSSLLVPIYCLFVFTVSGAVMSTPIPYRVAKAALNFAGNNIVKLFVMFGLGCSVLSMFISDLAASAIFCGIGISICEANGGVAKKSELGKAFTVLCGSTAAIGGIGTPVGNSLNMLCMSMVKSATGVEVTFGQWCVTMIPIAIVTSILASLYVAKAFKCEEIKPEALDVVKDKLSDYGKMSTREIKIIVWFVIVFGICLASTWVPAINSMLVCFIGAVIAFIPGISLLTKEDFDASVSWDIIMLIIGVQCLINGVMATGLITWAVGIIFAGAAEWPFIVVVIVAVVITGILHILIPIGPPTVTVALPVMFGIAAMVPEFNGTLIAAIGGSCGAVTSFLPFDAIMLCSYKYGWISMGDWLKKAWPPTVILWIVMIILGPIITGFFA